MVGGGGSQWQPLKKSTTFCPEGEGQTHLAFFLFFFLLQERQSCHLIYCSAAFKHKISVSDRTMPSFI